MSAQRQHRYAHPPARLHLIAWAALFLTALLTLSGGLNTAHAHDQIVDHSPGSNEVLSVSPDRVELHFNNSVLDIGEGATIVRVQDASGHELGVTAPSLNDRTVSVRLDAPLNDGAYRVLWRVVSSDGHPIEGTFAFAVGEGGEAALDSLPAIGEEHDHEHEHDHDQDHDEAATDGDAGMSPLVMALIGVGLIAITAVVAITVMVRVRRGSQG